MKGVGIFFGSSSGKTEKIAYKIKDRLIKFGNVEVFDIAEVSIADPKQFSLLIFGVPTWGIGRLQDDWIRFIINNPATNFKNCSIAFFGLGDQDGYPDTFNDGMGILYDAYKSSGFRHLGKWPVSGYSFEASRAVENDVFIGLALDEDNEAEKSDSRLDLWIGQIIKESNTVS